MQLNNRRNVFLHKTLALFALLFAIQSCFGYVLIQKSTQATKQSSVEFATGKIVLLTTLSKVLKDYHDALKPLQKNHDQLYRDLRFEYTLIIFEVFFYLTVSLLAIIVFNLSKLKSIHLSSQPLTVILGSCIIGYLLFTHVNLTLETFYINSILSSIWIATLAFLGITYHTYLMPFVRNFLNSRFLYYLSQFSEKQSFILRQFLMFVGFLVVIFMISWGVYLPLLYLQIQLQNYWLPATLLLFALLLVLIGRLRYQKQHLRQSLSNKSLEPILYQNLYAVYHKVSKRLADWLEKKFSFILKGVFYLSVFLSIVFFTIALYKKIFIWINI